MTTQGLTVLQAAIMKMQWTEDRQRVISQNIANADTPGYQARDMSPLNFKNLLKNSSSSLSLAGGIKLATTNAHDISGTTGQDGMPSPHVEKNPYSVSPSGNSVVLEEQMLKMNENYEAHRMASAIYQKNIDMLTAAEKAP
ncbi:MAG: flagellar basal body rod protein FlgB [Alphaproteobacteria bacterium]|nr:flagellar basal body rod protein FlgB [Alphaproteobacteria bacterium]MDE2336531.1 flagellar basal body rod protein FlgB [Alphaproteobacteria bacterium]